MNKTSSSIFAVVASYWIVSISLVFINKWLLSDKTLQLDIPFFITWFQSIISILIVVFTKYTLKLQKIYDNPVDGDIMLSKCWKIFPLSLIYCGMVSFNNLSLQYLGIAFYYIARSLTTIFNVVFTYAILGNKTSLKSIFCCMLLIIGYVIGSVAEYGTGSLSFIGLTFGVLASAFVALYAIYVKKYMAEVEGNIWLLSLYNNINSAFIFIPIILLRGEFTDLSVSRANADKAFWLLMIIAGIFGFAIGFLTALQIKYTSPLTHNVSGTAKAAFQTVLGVVTYMEYKPLNWWIGNVLVLFSSALYTYVRHQEMQEMLKNTDLKKLTNFIVENNGAYFNK